MRTRMPTSEARNAVATVLGALLVASGALLAPGRADAATSACLLRYWVAPDGSDAAAGDRAHPFRTLERARDAARVAPDRDACGVEVVLRGGDYRLAKTFVLDPRDGGGDEREVVYRAAPGETPRLLGSVPVRDWEPRGAGRGIVRAFVGTSAATRQLWVNGFRAQRARTEAYNPYLVPTDDGYRLEQPGVATPPWSNPTDVEIFTVAQWKIMSCPVGAVAGAEIVMAQPCWKNANVFPAPWNFRLVSWLENAYEFIDEPGEWYLDGHSGWLYYRPRPGEDMTTAEVELPVLETLVDVRGELDRPVSHLRFEGLTFAYATWLRPSGPEGYVADQSGFTVTGEEHEPNLIGHVEHVTRTPGNVRLIHARHTAFTGNTFMHLGSVALDFDTGSQNDAIVNDVFRDVSSAAIQLGGVAKRDHHPDFAAQVTRDNEIANNLIESTGQDYWDAAGIYVGFTTRSTVRNNDVLDTPWSGIAIGWGWGLFDEGGFPGLPHATQGMWGDWKTPSTSRENRIVANFFRGNMSKLWDGGAIYSNGAQGTSFDDGELIAGNVATDKRPAAGSNTFYTDGGSRWVTLHENVSLENIQGHMDFGPCGLPSSWDDLCFLELPYGLDAGGCVPYGDIRYVDNYFGAFGFFDICLFDVPPVVDVTERDNHLVSSAAEVPARILRAAGRRGAGAGRVDPIHGGGGLPVVR